MVVDRAKLSSSESAIARKGDEAPVSAVTVPAVVLSANEDTRLLLRGLLRLNRHPVVFEGRAAEELDGVPPGEGPRILLLDGDAVPGGWESAIRVALAREPSLRVILLTPDRSPALAARAREAGARTVLVRPFAIAEFIEALARSSEIP